MAGIGEIWPVYWDRLAEDFIAPTREILVAAQRIVDITDRIVIWLTRI